MDKKVLLPYAQVLSASISDPWVKKWRSETITFVERKSLKNWWLKTGNNHMKNCMTVTVGMVE